MARPIDELAARSEVRAYIASLPPDTRKALQTLRATIRAAAPGAIETRSYGILGYKLNGRPLVYAGGFAKHVSFYPLTPAIRRNHATELARYETSKGTVRFPLGKPIPVTFVKRLVKTRLAEIAAGK